MIRSISFKNESGDLLTLNVGSPDSSGLLIINTKGLGAPDSSINLVEGGNRDGGYITSMRSLRRTITLTIALIERVNEEVIRRSLYKFFRSKMKLEMTVSTDTADMVIDTYVETSPLNMFSRIENIEVTLVAPYPFFRDRDLEVAYIYAVSPGLVFPFSNNSLTESLLIFGSINNYPEVKTTNNGELYTGCNIDLHVNDTVTEIVIANNTTNEVMRIDVTELESIIGSSLTPGDDILINTYIGEKSITHVRSGVETNVLNSLGFDVEWIGIAPGENSLSYSTPEPFGNLDVKISFNHLYEGV